MILWLDRETWCELDLKEVGTYRYAEAAEDLLISYAVDDEPATVWDCTADPICPPDLEYALQMADEVWAHNAQFDKAVHKYQALPTVELERWRCSMAMALSHALPGGLSDLCGVLKVPEDKAKLSEGKKLVQLFTKPRPKNHKLRRASRLTHPAEWERFKAYAINDIEAMRECVKRMPRWNWNDVCIAEWHMDQRMNERGFHVDLELVAAGARAAVTEKDRITTEFRERTGGLTPGQRDKFKDFVADRYGLALDDTTRDTFEHMLKSPSLDPECAELFRLSMQANRTSTAKYAALHPAVQDDGRFRGGTQFSGAGRTRRWAGRLFQPQNLPSRGLPPAEMIERYIEALKHDAHDLLFDNLMLYGAAALRGVVVSAPGKKLVVEDLSNIEGRILAWVSQEHWKLKAFRDFDAGTGPDLYNITAVSIIGGDPWKVDKKNRNVFGKVPDLASGYQGGVAGYQTFAHAYGVRMADYWDVMQRSIDPAHIAKARDNFTKPWAQMQLESLEISELEWLASETCKLAWRARHPATVQFWYDLQRAMKSAINNLNVVYTVGPLVKLQCRIHKGNKWLVILLPSGRYLTYFSPHLMDDDTIAYWGEASEEGKTSRHWTRVFTHGGKATGNVCQTTARDVLAPAMLEAEQLGYLPVLSVHDEILTEVPDTPEFDPAGLAACLTRDRGWNSTLPLAAAGFQATRYKKD